MVLLLLSSNRPPTLHQRKIIQPYINFWQCLTVYSWNFHAFFHIFSLLIFNFPKLWYINTRRQPIPRFFVRIRLQFDIISYRNERIFSNAINRIKNERNHVFFNLIKYSTVRYFIKNAHKETSHYERAVSVPPKEIRAREIHLYARRCDTSELLSGIWNLSL